MIKGKYPRPQVWQNIEICEAIYKAYKEVAAEAGVGAPVPDFNTRYPNAFLMQIKDWLYFYKYIRAYQ